MAAVIPVITTPNLLLRHRLGQSCFLAAPRPSFAKWVRIQSNGFSKQRSCRCLAIDEKRIMEDFPENNNDEKEIADEVLKMAGTAGSSSSSVAVEEKLARKKSERFTYLAAAIMSSLGFISMSAFAVYYRFSWQMQGGEAVPLEEMVGTFALAVGAAVGMEYWARWAHRALWHASLWNMHESHHKPRKGPFELNDVFAIINAVPAMGLLGYGTLNKGLFPGLCFGALSFSTHDVAVSVAIITGLGITMFGMAYMFVHDGLVHRRFAVGPIADVPYLRRVAAAHQLHHSDIFDGVPYGLFLGPMELEETGGIKELDKEVQRRIKLIEENSS